MILLTLSRGKGEETVRLQLPASPAEIGETFAFLDRISLDTTATAILDVSSNVPVLYRCLYDVDVEDSEQFQKLQKLAERTEALSPAKAAIFSGALDAECVWNLEGALTVADRLDEYMALLDTTEEGSGFQERLLELLGEQHQEDHGGVFTDFGYAELGGEIKDIYVCQSNETACFHRSDAPVMLEVRKGFFNDPSYDNDKTAVLNLPAADAGIWRAVEKVDAASVDECAFRCVDCLIPFLRDAINNAKAP